MQRPCATSRPDRPCYAPARPSSRTRWTEGRLLKQALPKISRVAVLWNPANPAIHFYFEETKRAAALLQLALDPVAEVRGAEELDGAFAAMA